uniref:Uncharacterized protein n=1 Tax=Oryza rufipogon TaxID=4529 RepID=A0A0E0MU99_ORYRU
MVFLRAPDGTTRRVDLDPTTATLADLTASASLVSTSPTAASSRPCRPLSWRGGMASPTATTPSAPPPPPPPPAACAARYDFLNSKPPPNYVARLGRGAAGFTTRSDIGPAMGRGRGKPPGDDGDGDGGGDEEEKGYDENQKFDEFEGNDAGLFSNAGHDDDDDDREADAVWEGIDRRMDSRRKDWREARLKQEIESIPEIGDYSLRRNKKRRFESFVPVPDTLLEKARQEQGHVTALDPKSRAAAAGAETPWAQTPVTDLTAVGEGRGTVLSLKLDRLSDSVSGVTIVDPRGYLTNLKSMKITSDAEISDIKKARLLLKSVIQTNPKHPPGWIAAARLEEVAGKLQVAQQLIQRGCEECPTNEDVWLKACRLASPDEAKAVIARGVKEIPNSVKLWLQAAKLETSDLNKSRVLRKGLEHIPDSVRLWKSVVELANEEDARLLLHRAVECCPFHLELWLALARLETYDQAKKVLNKAKEKLPKEPAIWIMAAKLEEANGNTELVNEVIERSIKTLQGKGLGIDREAWLKEAEAAEHAGSVMTCQAIVKNTIGVGVDDEDRKRTWVADAEECKKRGSVETAPAIYAHALSVFKFKKSIWLKAAQLEKRHGTEESLYILLSKATTYNRHAEVLWLMYAKEKWLAGDVPAAQTILQEAYAYLPNSEEIWLAAFKLEFENNEPERARILLSKARERGGTERVWMKSAIVERELGNVDEERKLLEEEKINGLRKSRAVLTMARKKNPATPELWLAAVRAELRHRNKKEADALLAKALQECPTSGILWAAAIEMVPRPQRKAKSSDAIKRCDHDPHFDKARSWLNRAVTLAPDIGDFWALYYKFELQHGNADTHKDVVQRCVASEPKHGERWQAIAKAVENSHLSIEALLKKAVVALGQDENPNAVDP